MGVPSSAASYAASQDLAPAALRCHGDPAALARFVTSITRILAATIH